MKETRALVLIPARMAATRLPGKPLLDISGLPMIVHVVRRADAARIGRVVVATDAPDIAEIVTAHGGEAVMTRADHPSGSDRIFEALQTLDGAGQIDTIINVQGDLPTIAPEDIRAVLAPLADPGVASVTPMSNDAEIFTAPVLCAPAGLAPGQALAMDAVARRLDPAHARSEAPTGVGFCMALPLPFLSLFPLFSPSFFLFSFSSFSFFPPFLSPFFLPLSFSLPPPPFLSPFFSSSLT